MNRSHGGSQLMSWGNILRKKKINFFLILSSSLTLVLFQNCNSGVSGGSSNSILSTANNPCPANAMGSPEMSPITVVGTSTLATTVSTQSGYTSNSGNTLSNPILELSLLKTNVTPEDTCAQSASIRCAISIDAGSTGVLWGTSERVALSSRDFECVAGSDDLDIDVEGKPSTDLPNKTTLQIQPNNQSPDITSDTHVCMQGSGTVRVSLQNPYGKSSEIRSFKFTFTNKCPKEQKINAENESEAAGAFGESVSISGQRAAVLTTGLNAFSLVNIGGVRIYEFNGTQWNYIPPTIIPPLSELENDVKPNTVLLSGDYLFIGNAAINNQSGRIWMYQRNSSGVWNKLQTVDGTTGSKFGSSFAFNGTHLFVGAPSISSNGAVKIYSLTSNTLNLVSTINGTTAKSDFGVSIAVSGTRLAIGAPGNAINTTTTGIFFICDISSISNPICNPWALSNGNRLGNDVIPLTANLGSQVALKSNLLLVSARGWYSANLTTPPANRNGLVSLIDLNQGSAAIKNFRGGSGELFGSSIAFSTSSFFIGAKESIEKRGRVIQMSLPADGSINATQRYQYFGLNQGPQDRFGSSLSVSGNKLLVGAPLDEENSFATAGSATFFEILNP